MRNALLWIGFWLLTLLGAWWIGSGGMQSGAQEGVGDSESDVALLEAEVERLRAELESRGPVLRLGDAGTRSAAREGAEVARSSASVGGGVGETEAAAFSLHDVTTADEAMQRFFAYVQRMLAKGEQGHLELLKTFNDVLYGSKENQAQLEHLFGDDREATRY